MPGGLLRGRQEARHASDGFLGGTEQTAGRTAEQRTPAHRADEFLSVELRVGRKRLLVQVVAGSVRRAFGGALPGHRGDVDGLLGELAGHPVDLGREEPLDALLDGLAYLGDGLLWGSGNLGKALADGGGGKLRPPRGRRALGCGLFDGRRGGLGHLRELRRLARVAGQVGALGQLRHGAGSLGALREVSGQDAPASGRPDAAQARRRGDLRQGAKPHADAARHGVSLDGVAYALLRPLGQEAERARARERHGLDRARGAGLELVGQVAVLLLESLLVLLLLDLGEVCVPLLLADGDGARPEREVCALGGDRDHHAVQAEGHHGVGLGARGGGGGRSGRFQRTGSRQWVGVGRAPQGIDVAWGRDHRRRRGLLRGH